MAFLPPEWISHLAAGVSHRLGSCGRDGRPAICRAMAAELLDDGRVRLLLTGDAGGEVLAAIRETGQVSAVMALPESHRTLHLKGRDAVVEPAGLAESLPLIDARFEALVLQLMPLGFRRESLRSNWYAIREDDLYAVAFTVYGAWNQTPGPGAGQAVELLP